MDTVLMYNEEIEKSILGAIFLDNDLFLEINNFQKEVFYVSANQELFKIMKKLYKDNGVIEIVTITDYILKNKLNEKISINYAAEIATSECSIAAFKTHVKLLKDFYTKRKIKKEVIKIDFSKDAEELKATYLNSANELCKEEKDSKILNSEYMAKYIESYYGKDKIKGVPTQYKALDNRMICFENKSLIGIAAAQGIGKTTLATAIFTKMIMNNYKASFVTIEMTKNQIVDKVVACGSRVNYWRLRKQTLTKEEEEKMIMFSNILSSKGENFEIYEEIYKIEDICNQIRKDKINKDIDIAFIDLLNRIGSSEIKENNRTLFLSEITAQLKRLAKELDIPIIVTAQINRTVEKQCDKRPILADIKESGGLGEDADYVLGLYRNREFDDEKYVSMLEEKGKIKRWSKNPDDNPDRCEISILKGRFSGTAKFTMISKPEFQDIWED